MFSCVAHFQTSEQLWESQKSVEKRGKALIQ